MQLPDLRALLGYSKSAYGAGTVPSLTATSALLTFGTTSPTVTLDRNGLWLIFAIANLKYNAATFAANQTATLKLRRTNNTAADLTNATRTVDLEVLTATTKSAGQVIVPPVVYSATKTDIVQLWGAVSVIPSAGSLDVTSAEIVALYLRAS